MVKILKKLVLFAALVLTSYDLSAAELYNLDFSAPETGSYQTVFGTPTIQSSVGSFQNALVFDAVSSYEQIRLPLTSSGPGIKIEYDVITHNLRNSLYSFDVVLDTPQVRSFDFHGGLNTMQVYRPGYLASVAYFSDDQVYHVGMVIDFESNLWTINIDGEQITSLAFNASDVQSVRFNMSPWRLNSGNAPGTFAAIDNLTIATIPEPSTWSLVLAAMIPAYFGFPIFRRLRRSSSH